MQVVRNWARYAPLVGLVGILGSVQEALAGDYEGSPQVAEFVAQMTRDYGFAGEQLIDVFREVERKQAILDAISRPAERVKQWKEYRPMFITDARIARGVDFWRQHEAALARAEQEYGVPAQVIVSIIGVETFFGRNTGNYRVIDALSTLGFDYPPRADFFRKELQQFLMMSREEGLDPREPLGSYAGAMGVPQFMPSSFRRFAVDGSGDGHRNLWEPGADVFASIANYLRESGWRAGEPVLVDARIDSSPDDPASVKLALNETVTALQERGYQFEASLPGNTPVVLVPAQLQDAMSWRIGFQNFYAITRYNRSPLYAMAVHDLAQEIAARYKVLPVATPERPLQPGGAGS